MAVNRSTDNLIFNYFVSEDQSSAKDYQSARIAAGQQGLQILKNAITNGYTVGDILTALYQVFEQVGDVGREWVKGMLDFVKSFKPGFESVKNRFAPNGQQGDIEVVYDETAQVCMAYVSYLVDNAATALVPGLNVNALFDKEKLSKFRSLCSDPGSLAALDKFKKGQKLNLYDREKLQSIFAMASEVMEVVSADFADLGGNVNGTSTVLISEESLTGMATRLTNKQTRRIDDLIEQIRSSFNLAQFIR